MKILKSIVLILALLIGAVLLITAVMPKDYIVEESITINKPAKEIYTYVSDLKNWNDFTIWKQMDPEMSNTYEGAESGVGAKMIWTSDKVGSGSLAISEAEANKSITTDLVFTTPHESKSNGSWKFEETDAGTKVSWANYGTSKWPVEVLIMRLFGFKQISSSFSQGLSNLKEKMESMESHAEYTLSEFVIKEMEPMSMYSITNTIKISDLEKVMGDWYGKLMAHVGSEGMDMNDVPLAVYHDWNPEDGTTKLECGIPVENPGDGAEEIKASQTPGGKSLVLTLTGSYEYLGVAHEAIEAYMKENNLQSAGGLAWERYTNDPAEVAPEEIETVIYYPVKDNSEEEGG